MSATTLIAIAALFVAVIAYAQSRRTARQLAQITEMYWQLKFEHGELKARLDKAVPDPDQPPRTPPGTQFVPLASVKR